MTILPGLKERLVLVPVFEVQNCEISMSTVWTVQSQHYTLTCVFTELWQIDLWSHRKVCFESVQLWVIDETKSNKCRFFLICEDTECWLTNLWKKRSFIQSLSLIKLYCIRENWQSNSGTWTINRNDPLTKPSAQNCS